MPVEELTDARLRAMANVFPVKPPASAIAGAAAALKRGVHPSICGSRASTSAMDQGIGPHSAGTRRHNYRPAGSIRIAYLARARLLPKAAR
jgi:hypothetical protein